MRRSGKWPRTFTKCSSPCPSRGSCCRDRRRCRAGPGIRPHACHTLVGRDMQPRASCRAAACPLQVFHLSVWRPSSPARTVFWWESHATRGRGCSLPAWSPPVCEKQRSCSWPSSHPSHWVNWPIQRAIDVIAPAGTTSRVLINTSDTRCGLPWIGTTACAPEMKVADEIQVVAAFCACAQHLLPACQRACKYLEYQGDPCVRVALFLLSSNSYRSPDGGAKK